MFVSVLVLCLALHSVSMYVQCTCMFQCFTVYTCAHTCAHVFEVFEIEILCELMSFSSSDFKFSDLHI